MSNCHVSLEGCGRDLLNLREDDLRRLLALARIYGWEPADRTVRFALYYPLEGPEMIPAGDARQIAATLANAIDDLPNHDAKRHKFQDVLGWLSQIPGQHISPIEWFSGPSKEIVRSFVAFCRRGEFRVSVEVF